MTANTRLRTVASLLLIGLAAIPLRAADDITAIRRETTTGFAHAGWKYDRYGDLPSLDAGKSMVVADLKGPGVIRHIHTCRHQNPELNARGIVLEVWYDDADKPAVRCPLADFFGDGCNGRSMYFSSKFIECAPWSYNAYFPMPFAKRARVLLRNDTAKDVMNYSYVEWEPLAQWKADTGYFHATYRRQRFALTRDTRQTFFHVKGAGHVLGRQFSVETDEPIFHDFQYVMEGNNEIDIDGRERALDYLGTEDSFTFSWGFQTPFAGLRAGMPLVQKSRPNLLSVYRFHDHLPIRFARELTWSINWRHEKMFTARPEWARRAAEGGCQVDYATVFYWYQDSPAGLEHDPLPPADQRGSAARATSIESLVRAAPEDKELALTFDRREDLGRVAIGDCWPGTHPLWIDQPQARGGHPGNPNPGRRGVLALHGASASAAATLVRKVAVPADFRGKLRLAVSGDPYEGPGRGADFVLRAGLWEGGKAAWLTEQVVAAGEKPEAANWRTLDLPLKDVAGKTVAIVVQVAYGGRGGVFNEEAFFDEISLVRE